LDAFVVSILSRRKFSPPLLSWRSWQVAASTTSGKFRSAQQALLLAKDKFSLQFGRATPPIMRSRALRPPPGASSSSFLRPHLFEAVRPKIVWIEEEILDPDFS
jgi:hypothetical protein